MTRSLDLPEIQETNKLFVVGTDTGVGKTMVSRTIARILADQGVRVRVVKPLESGCAKGEDGELIAADAEALREAARLSPEVEVCRYKGEKPVTPAEALGDKAPSLDDIQIFLESVLNEETDFTLAEGAGGLMVPYTKDALLIELLSALEWPVLLVGRSSLGTINHVLLSLLALEKYKVPVFGVVLSRPPRGPGARRGEEPLVDRSLRRGSPVHLSPRQTGATERYGAAEIPGGIPCRGVFSKPSRLWCRRWNRRKKQPSPTRPRATRSERAGKRLAEPPFGPLVEKRGFTCTFNGM